MLERSGSSTPPAERAIPAVEILSFVTGYNDPCANVVIVSSDQIGLRVHDYYLKAARYVFGLECIYSILLTLSCPTP
jgi:hypothetical protein